jgi:hypothetical protein
MSQTASRTQTVFPFLYLKECAQFHLRESESNQGNLFHSSMSCIIFSAFTMEAFLNYIGSCVFDFWDELERHLTSVNKLNVICSQLQIHSDFSDRPFQSFVKAFNLKHYLNQGKIDSYASTVHLTSTGSAPEQPEWEKQCNPREARQIYDDMLQIMRILDQKVEGEVYPLSIDEVDQAHLTPS